MSRPVADFHYDLPVELIATRPATDRDGSRMLVVDRSNGTIAHRHFREFPSMLGPGDLVALNDSRVIKARLLTEGGRIEIFLLEALGANRWKCLTRPGRKMRAGATVAIAETEARVEEVLPGGERVIAFREAPDLEKYGHMPLPPYFHRDPDDKDDERYQTVYAGRPGSVAAPTAGLHFTPAQLAAVPHVFLTLHVGAGTFLPVKAATVEEHVMHEECYDIPAPAASALNAARRIIAVGTTVTRVL